jgi:biopolymer transport protein TolQ
MEQQVIDSVTLGGSVAPHDLSVWGLFIQADLIVKIVIFLLVLASIWCWAIIFDKVFRLRRLRGKANRFEEAFWSGGSLDDLYDRLSERPGDPMSSTFVAAMREWRRSLDRGIHGDTSRHLHLAGDGGP